MFKDPRFQPLAMLPLTSVRIFFNLILKNTKRKTSHHIISSTSKIVADRDEVTNKYPSVGLNPV